MTLRLLVLCSLAAAALAAGRREAPRSQDGATEAFLRAPAIRTSPGPEYADGPRRFQGIPGIERAANGRLWAVWYGGGLTEDRYNHVLLVTSADEGATWSAPVLVIDPDGDGPVRAFDPCLWRDPAGRLWLFWAQGYENHTDGRSGVWAIVTGDPGSARPTWSAPVRISDGILMNKPTVLASGEWLLATARWKLEKSVRIVGSADRGRTWKAVGQAGIPDPADRNCDEPMLVERADGSLWLLVRTQYGIGESVSTDRGRTWTPVARSAIGHATARFFVRRLGSGRLLLVKHGPIGERTGRARLTAYLSEDDGRTWLGGLLLDERTGVSYPDGVEAPGGTLLVVYDFDRRGEKEILLARFTEEDVRAGRFASSGAAARMRVNKARGANDPALGRP